MPAPQVSVVQLQRLRLVAPEGVTVLHTPSASAITWGRAEARRPASICARLKPGLAAHISDAAPATWGAAKLVPLPAA